MENQHGLRVSEAAFDQLARILDAETKAGRAGLALRVAVLGGGCSGFQYRFELEPLAEAEPDDARLRRGDAVVLVDSASQPLLSNSELDFKREMIGARFVIENPNATSTCGCGSSFSI